MEEYVIRMIPVRHEVSVYGFGSFVNAVFV